MFFIARGIWAHGEIALLYAEDLTVFIRRRHWFGLVCCRRIDDVPNQDFYSWFGHILIIHIGFINNWGSQNCLCCHQEKCMEGRSASLSTCTIWQRVHCSQKWLDSYLGVILAVSQKWTIYSSPIVTINSITKYGGPACTSGFHAAFTHVALFIP